MISIHYYQPGEIDDTLLFYAVIISTYQGQWVFCRHVERDTWEIPGGHREPGEDILTTAKRELYEETGALRYQISPVSVYSVVNDGKETFGMLYTAEIAELGPLPALEIAEIRLFSQTPQHLTYPLIQPLLVEHVRQSRREEPDK